MNYFLELCSKTTIFFRLAEGEPVVIDEPVIDHNMD